jgi:hypothetical protein
MPQPHPVAEGGRRQARRVLASREGRCGAVWGGVGPSYTNRPVQTLVGANTVKQRVWTKFPSSSNKTLDAISTSWNEPFLWRRRAR